MPTIFRFRRADTANVASAILTRGQLYIDNQRNSHRGLLTLSDGKTPGGLDVGFFELSQNTYIFIPNTEWNASFGKHSNDSDYRLDVNGSIQFSNSINNSYLNGNVNGTISINLGAAGNVSADYSTISGGMRNEISQDYCFIGSGANNLIANTSSFIGGGEENKITAKYSVIGGGKFNTVNTGHTSTISGGSNNKIHVGDYSFIGAGELNYIDTVDHSVIGGGYNNFTNGHFSSVLGGNKNVANGNYSSVLGGSENKSLGDYSLSFGRKARANNAGSLIFKDSRDLAVTTFVDDSAVLCFQNGVFIKCGDLRIQNNLIPTSNLVSDIGSPSKYINNIYANNINISSYNFGTHKFQGNTAATQYTLPNGKFFVEGSTMLFVDTMYWDYYSEVQNANGTFNKIEISTGYPIPDGANCVLRFWRA